MANPTNIGTFYQGQVVSVVVSTPSDATASEKAMLRDNDLYLGIYGPPFSGRKIYSSQDGTLLKTVDASGNVTLACVISALETKEMHGEYHIEILIKNSDNSFTAPCKNCLSFLVEKRFISEVIK